MEHEKKQILVVDDEVKITEVIDSFLSSRGYCVYTAESAREALELFRSKEIALLILDIMLPDMSGEEICRVIRRESPVPIIMLTARVEEEDLLQSLALGADDYMTKPFSLKELHARVEAVLRRTQAVLPHTRKSFRDSDLIVDFEKNEVLKKHKPVALTPSESKLLAALIRHPGKVYTREELILLALGGEFDGYDRAIDSHIKNLRQKIEDNPREPVYVRTVHGMGYKFGGDMYEADA
ncbi:MAG: response regulator transcription factor [Lachnospiraceae bacterium]